MDCSDQLALKAVENAQKEHQNIEILGIRRFQVNNVSINLNSFTELQLLEDFRFRLSKFKKISQLLGWIGITARNSYVCEPTLACKIFLYRTAPTSRWYDWEPQFRMYSSQMPEIYWELVELLDEKCKHWSSYEDSFSPKEAPFMLMQLKLQELHFQIVLDLLKARKSKSRNLEVTVFWRSPVTQGIDVLIPFHNER